MDDDGTSGIGKRVRAYRRAAGMTADQLAAKVDGLTGNAVAKLENGHRKDLTTDLLVQIAWALQVPPMALLFPLEDPNGRITIGSQASGTSETLGYWLQGLSVPGVEVTDATSLADAVHSEHRRLVVNSLGLLNSVQEQLVERGALTAQDVDELGRRRDLAAEAIHVGRQSLEILRKRLGLESDG